MAARPPVIIIGMHRAGTSMLTRTMQGFGFFMGQGTTRNEECRWTNALNYWIFRQASATWERPEGVDALLADETVRPLVSDYLRGVTGGPACARYLGAQWFRFRSMHAIDRAWGWKDPRNTFSLPFWLDVFPEARVLHIMRHGVDVAESLRVRREKAVMASAARYRKRRRWYVNHPLAPKRNGFGHSPSVGRLEGGLRLWRTYTERARSHVRDLGGRALELRYEDLLREPRRHLAEITAFCGLEATAQEIDREASRFRPERAFAFRHDEPLARFAREHASELDALGYAA